MKKRTASDKSSGSGSIPTWQPCNTLLFVYGTLLSGARAHPILLALGAKAPIKATLPHHVLYHFVPGDYPLAFPGEGQIKGEIWEIPLEALMILDIYEGIKEGLYQRCLLEVSTEKGSKTAWVYRGTPQAMKALRDKLQRVPGDHWLSWKRGSIS